MPPHAVSPHAVGLAPLQDCLAKFISLSPGFTCTGHQEDWCAASEGISDRRSADHPATTEHSVWPLWRHCRCRTASGWHSAGSSSFAHGVSRFIDVPQSSVSSVVEICTSSCSNVQSCRLPAQQAASSCNENGSVGWHPGQSSVVCMLHLQAADAKAAAAWPAGVSAVPWHAFGARKVSRQPDTSS